MSLTLGTFPLLIAGEGSVTRETVHALVGSDLGNPEVIERALSGWMRHGSVEWVEGYGNRSQSVLVMLQAGNAAALSDLEGALWREVQKGRNTLTWEPGGLAPTTVYRVQWAHLQHAWDDGDHLHEFVRFFTLTLRCEPFAFSPTAVTTLAAARPLPATPAVTSVDACSYATPAAAAAAGWSGVTNAFGTSIARIAYGEPQTLTRTFASATSVGPILRIEANAEGSVLSKPVTVQAAVGGVWVNLTRVQTYGTFVEFAAPSPVLALKITGGEFNPFTAATTLTIVDVSKQDIATPLGSRRLNTHTLDVQGSSPTPATVVLDSGADTPGDIFLYAWDANRFGTYSPDVTGYANGTPASTVDATTLSGSRVDCTSGAQFDIPTVHLPTGSYQMLARVKAATTAVRDVSVLVATIGWTDATTLPTVSKTITNAWSWVRLASLTLPTVDVVSGGTTQRVTVVGAFEIDTLCLCLRSIPSEPGRRIGSLVITANDDTTLTAITGGSSPSAPMPGIFRRTGSTNIHVDSVQAFDPLILAAGENTMWVACSTADDGVEVSAEYHPAGHTTAPVVR